MAKKKDKDNTLLMAILLGVGGYMLIKKSTTNTGYQIPPNYNQIPPAPVQNTPAWQQWVAAIISVFGTAANLWAPGGPFYKQPITQNQAIEIAKGQDYSNVAGVYGLRAVKVTYSDGTVITTSMAANLTDKEIREYFKIGRVFNIGNVVDKLVQVTKVQILR